MSYIEFLSHHPELNGYDQSIKDLAYASYLEMLDHALKNEDELMEE